MYSFGWNLNICNVINKISPNRIRSVMFINRFGIFGQTRITGLITFPHPKIYND